MKPLINKIARHCVEAGIVEETDLTALLGRAHGQCSTQDGSMILIFHRNVCRISQPSAEIKRS